MKDREPLSRAEWALVILFVGLIPCGVIVMLLEGSWRLME